MAEVEIIRETGDDSNGTFGSFQIDGKERAVTCELPWRDNAQGISCIPAGTYTVIKWSSDKVKQGFRIQDVPERSLIDIHCGNTVRDIEGCVVVGLVKGTVKLLDGEILSAVLHSHDAMNVLYSELPDTFELTIR